MAKGEKSKGIVDAEGNVFGPCGDCCFWIEGEGSASGKGMGRCHGAAPAAGHRFPPIAAVEKGCASFKPAGSR